MLYEIISPDIFLRKYIDDYLKLAAMYGIIRKFFSPRPIVAPDFMRKTESLVREKVGAYLDAPTSTIKLNEEIITAIKSANTGKAKVINLVIQIIRILDTAGQPHLISIKERAEAILEGYENRQLTTEAAIKEIEELYRKYQSAQKERKEKNFNENTFTAYWVLKNENIAESEKLAAEIDALVQKYPHYRDNAAEMRQLKAELYKILLPAAGKEKMVQIVRNILEMRKA